MANAPASHPYSAAISDAPVRANQLPRGVSWAEALLPRSLSVNMPSRLRSATVIPATGLSCGPAASATHTPYRLCKVPPPFKQAMRAARLAVERFSIGAGCSFGASCCPEAGTIGARWSSLAFSANMMICPFSRLECWERKSRRLQYARMQFASELQKSAIHRIQGGIHILAIEGRWSPHHCRIAAPH
jgi:hypothetical protein